MSNRTERPTRHKFDLAHNRDGAQLEDHGDLATGLGVRPQDRQLVGELLSRTARRVVRTAIDSGCALTLR
jgi:hypothetical protein